MYFCFISEIAINLSGKADIFWWISIQQKYCLCYGVLWNLSLNPMSVHYILTNIFLNGLKKKPNWSQCFAILAFSLFSAKHAQEVFVDCI